MPSLNHIHTYERSRHNKRVYRCVHPDCSHYDKIENLEGKRAHCKCGVDFILTCKRPQRHFQYAIPKCEECRVSKNSKAKKLAEEIIQNLLAPVSAATLGQSPIAEVETILRPPSSEPVQFELERGNEQPSLLQAQEEEEEVHEWD